MQKNANLTCLQSVRAIMISESMSEVSRIYLSFYRYFNLF